MRYNRAINELYVGHTHMNVDGPSVKHPSNIHYYGNVNVNKMQKNPVKLVGIDIETDAKTGETKLIGYYDNKYQASTGDDMILMLLTKIKRFSKNNINFAHWNRLDPYQILKLMIKNSKCDYKDSLKRYGKVSGEFDSKQGTWTVNPIVSIDAGNHGEFGIKTALRSSIQFYWIDPLDLKIYTCWSYDIAGHYNGGIETNAKKYGLTYYSKMGNEYHIIDWERYETDVKYRSNVLKSNELDARAAQELGMKIQKQFHDFIETYPSGLISQGQLARTAIVANINKKYQGLEKKERKKQVYDDVSSVGIIRHLDTWIEKHGDHLAKQLYYMATESYSGGYIDAIHYGIAEEGWYADIASAYPGTIQTLLDLRGSTLETGNGKPKKTLNGYTFVRGEVNIPDTCNYHPLTIRHPYFKETNIRAVGEYRASYTIEEREFLEEQGATFKNEEWITIKTLGKLSPLAQTCTDFINLRKHYLKTNNPSQYMAKIAVNSMYGILFEAVDLHEEGDVEPQRIGYRAGEFWNPIYASIITSRTRLILAKAATEIEKNGGKPVILMTDSITWTGKSTDMPAVLKLPFGESGIKEEKTLGYFENPEPVRNIICLGSGRYGFEIQGKNGWYSEVKRRGLNIIGTDEGDLEDHDFTWENVIERMKKTTKEKIPVKVRVLISPGLIAHSQTYKLEDLGRIIDQVKNIDPIVGHTKRIIAENTYDVNELSTKLIPTQPIYLHPSMFNKQELDQTYPNLRKLSQDIELKTRKERMNKRKNDWQHKNYQISKATQKEQQWRKYHHCKDYGYTGVQARRMSRWSWERIENEIGGK